MIIISIIALCAIALIGCVVILKTETKRDININRYDNINKTA